MNVEVREIKVGNTDQVASDVQHAMFALDQDGFRIVSVVPIAQRGDTTMILVCGVKPD